MGVFKENSGFKVSKNKLYGFQHFLEKTIQFLREREGSRNLHLL